MAFLDFFAKVKVPNVSISESKIDSEVVGMLETPLTLTDSNAVDLAKSVSEIFFPIDFVADRASKLRYFICDKKGNEVPDNDINRFINSPNPLQTFGDYCYEYIFNALSDGNTIVYKQVPTTYKGKPSISNISRIDVLNPDYLSLTEYSNLSRLSISNKTEFIKSAKYKDATTKETTLNTELLSIYNIDSNFRESTNLFAKSPLYRASKSINTLLAAYSARYNVYKNNGAAGYLVKKNYSENGVMAAVNPVDRDAMLKDINDRHGLTGRKSLYGISSIPIEFINTLVTIKDLMPFEETMADAIQIAGVYQIPANLIPRDEQAKYENQLEAEKSVWENTIKSMVNVFCENTTKDLMLDQMGYRICADYSSVSALAINEKSTEEVLSARIENLIKISSLRTGAVVDKDVDTEIKKIIDYYGSK